MKIKSAKFITGVVGEDAILYNGIPQIAFIGRSNVGKSSTLNALLGTKKLVKVGKTAGKTREINFFDVRTDSNEHVYFVDLAGYAYAKASKVERKRIADMIDWYLTTPRIGISLVCLIIDAKAGITKIDREFIKLLEQQKLDYIICVNKIDKLNQKEKHNLSKSLQEEGQRFILYSANQKKNIDELLQNIL